MTGARDAFEQQGQDGDDPDPSPGSRGSARVLPLSRGAGPPRRLHNLPHPATRFVGRAAELARLQGWSRSTRLLTLAGAGGIGKTRLALELARSATDQFADGVWFVELASLDRPSLVPQAVAAVLDVHDPAQHALPDVLAAAIGQRELLLLIDNCEHLVDACADLVARLLRACPNLAILATSREPLGIDGESTWRVPGLALPTGDSYAEIASAEAVDLFLDRARARRPDLAITQQNAADLVQICRRLDGLPLALELAAARVDVLAPSEIVARLDERFDLLTGGSRVVLPRHRTLRALVDWSHALLSPADQAVFRRLAVFVGGWTLEAAEAVVLDADAHQSSGSVRALDALARLTARSLIQAEPHGGHTRYRLLETIRAYSLQLLEVSGEAACIRQRHADYFLHLLERPHAQPGHESMRQDLDRLEREHDNLRAALAWFRDCAQTDAGLRLTGHLWWFWSVRGYLGEGRTWLRTFLDRADAGHTGTSASLTLRVRALYGSGVLARLQGDIDDAHDLQHRALATARAIGDDRGAALALTELADVADSRGAYADARKLIAAAIAIWRRLAYDRELAGALARLSRIALRQNDLAVVGPLLQESRQLAELIGSADILAACHFYLGELATMLHDRSAAAGHYRESLALFQELGYQRWIARTLEAFASLDAASFPERALRFAGAAARLRATSGQPLSPSERERLNGRLAPAREALGERAANLDVPPLEAVLQTALATTEAQATTSDGAAGDGQDGRHPRSGTPDVLAHACSGVTLTRREWEVVELLARGYSNPQISTQLVVSRRTVEAHVTAILNKLGLSSRTQVAVWAVEHGMHNR